MLIQDLKNSSKTWVCIRSPTWSNVCEKQPISITSLYSTFMVLMATSFTVPWSCIEETTRFWAIESSVDSTVMSCNFFTCYRFSRKHHLADFLFDDLINIYVTQQNYESFTYMSGPIEYNTHILASYFFQLAYYVMLQNI